MDREFRVQAAGCGRDAAAKIGTREYRVSCGTSYQGLGYGGRAICADCTADVKMINQVLVNYTARGLLADRHRVD